MLWWHRDISIDASFDADLRGSCSYGGRGSHANNAFSTVMIMTDKIPSFYILLAHVSDRVGKECASIDRSRPGFQDCQNMMYYRYDA